MAETQQYEYTSLSGHATAILGNKYGDTYNLQQATILLNSTAVPTKATSSHKVVRQNQILAGGSQTLETITTYNNGESHLDRGTYFRIEHLWKRCEDLGAGVFGEVHREECFDEKETKSRAVKVLRRRQLEYMHIDYMKELDALIQLSNPSYVHRFVDFFAWYEDRGCIYLAMEFIPYGNLEHFVSAELSEPDTKAIAYQVLDGLSIMHSLDLIHRDIKPANIFVVQHRPLWWVKIGDFSICKSTVTRQTILRTQVGTEGYQAPEILGLSTSAKPKTYDSRCDIWSFGVLVFEMLTKRLPFADLGCLTSYCNRETPFPGSMIKQAGRSLHMAQFAWCMLQPEPKFRPTTAQAIFLLSYRCHSDPSHESAIGHPKCVYLQDCVGRDFELPWDRCSTWSEMLITVRLAVSYLDCDMIPPTIGSDGLSFINQRKETLNSCNWDTSLRPGDRLLMLFDTEAPDHNVTTSLSDRNLQVTTHSVLVADVTPLNTELGLPSTSSVPETSAMELQATNAPTFSFAGNNSSTVPAFCKERCVDLQKEATASPSQACKSVDPPSPTYVALVAETLPAMIDQTTITNVVQNHEEVSNSAASELSQKFFASRDGEGLSISNLSPDNGPSSSCVHSLDSMSESRESTLATIELRSVEPTMCTMTNPSPTFGMTPKTAGLSKSYAISDYSSINEDRTNLEPIHELLRQENEHEDARNEYVEGPGKPKSCHSSPSEPFRCSKSSDLGLHSDRIGEHIDEIHESDLRFVIPGWYPQDAPRYYGPATSYLRSGLDEAGTAESDFDGDDITRSDRASSLYSSIYADPCDFPSQATDPPPIDPDKEIMNELTRDLGKEPPAVDKPTYEEYSGSDSETEYDTELTENIIPSWVFNKSIYLRVPEFSAEKHRLRASRCWQWRNMIVEIAKVMTAWLTPEEDLALIRGHFDLLINDSEPLYPTTWRQHFTGSLRLTLRFWEYNTPLRWTEIGIRSPRWIQDIDTWQRATSPRETRLINRFPSITFTDWWLKDYEVPMGLCCVWPRMFAFIRRISDTLSCERYDQAKSIRKGCFDIYCQELEACIPRNKWSAHIKPGMHVYMVPWPLCYRTMGSLSLACFDNIVRNLLRDGMSSSDQSKLTALHSPTQPRYFRQKRTVTAEDASIAATADKQEI